MSTHTIPVTASATATTTLEDKYEHEETRELVDLVNDAAERIQTEGEAAFAEFLDPGSRWRQGETYVFVLDPDGTMLVHPDPALAGANALELRDVNGKAIIRGLIGAATVPGKPEGWYHYQWPVPGGLFPRWKSSYVRRVDRPSGKSYIVGSGMYDERMERAFVVDLVTNAVAEIERRGESAFPLFRDPTGPYIAKDAYVFVMDLNGVEILNPAFPNLEGLNLQEMRDTRGKYLNREIIELVKSHGSGWVDYMWPKPGESVSTLKSTYVSRAMLGDRPVLVGCGVYLADAPRETLTGKTTAPDLMKLVRDAAALLEAEGEKAYPELRKQGSKWLHDDTYIFVYTMDGIRALLPTESGTEGQDWSGLKDVIGRPVTKMILAAGNSPSGEGWVHYMYPEPGSVFPAWKSSFVKRVTYPSGTLHVVGSGIYSMRMDRSFIEDLVNRAAALVAERGKAAFDALRDRTGPFVFMDTYVFVQSPDGTELVNPALPALEGRNLMNLEDLEGRVVIRDEIDAALKQGSAWVPLTWFRPGDNIPARKQTYVRTVLAGDETFIVGSGIYED